MAYARAKQFQVVLNREWSRRVALDQGVFSGHAPGLG